MDRPRDALAEGTELAGYVIGRVLGRGGFGITYLAADALYSDVRVAIKEFLPTGLALREPGDNSVHPASAEKLPDYAKALARFEDEARTLVALRHPAIVEAQRFIKANGTAYVVMKYEEGTSLGKRIANGATMTAAEIARILPPLLDGLEQIHARAFIHRDIKPDNIYLRAADGSPVLLDFGAARQAMAEERKTSLTEIVTPGYAPYEQYDRTSAQGPYTDIYALGATLYRCITGEKPAEAPARVKAAARREPDPMPPARSAAKSAYPPPLLAAIDKALAVFEADRPQSIAEFRRLLAGEGAPAAAPATPAPDATLVAGAAVHAPRSAPAAAEPTAQPRRQRPMRTIAAGLAALVLIGGGYYAWSEYRAGQQRAGAEAQQRAAAEAARKAEEEAKKRRAQDDEVRRQAEEAQRREAEERARREDESRKRAEEETKRKADEEKSAADTKACTSGEDAAAIAACTRIINRGGTPENVAIAYYNRAFRHISLKQYARAIDDCTRAIELKPDYADAYIIRGIAYRNLKYNERAIRDYDKAIELKPNFANAYYNRGNVFVDLTQYQRAIRDYDKAIELRPDDEVAYHNRGHVYAALKQYQRAIRDFDKAIELKPDDPNPYNSRGAAYGKLKQYQRAIRDYDKAIELKPSFPEAYNNRGNTFSNLNQYRRAIRDYDKAIELKPDLAYAYYNRGAGYQSLGNRAAAIRDYRNALRLGFEDARRALRILGAAP